MKTYRAAALAAILAASTIASPASALEDARKGVDGEGYITAWLILAPIAPEADQEGPAALEKEQLAEESGLKPKPDDKVEVGGKEMAWKKAEAKEGALDFVEIAGEESENGIVYAVSYVVAEDDVKDATLKFGSDDQARVYLNGTRVHSTTEERSQEKDQDSVGGLALKKGRNVLVVKVVNGGGGEWAASARFVDKDGKPVGGITATTDPE